MKIEALQTLHIVVREGSFAAAAELTHLTPSAVSMQMKQLERYLGQTLFDRSGLQVRPTDFALEVVDAMEPALKTLSTLRRRQNRGTELQGLLKVGVIEALQPVMIPAILRHLRRNHPKLQILPKRGSSHELTDAVKAGQLHAAVVARPKRGQFSQLRWHVLAKRSLMLLAPLGEAAGDLPALMARLDWIRYDRQTTTGQLAGRVVQKYAPGKRSVVELDNVAAIAATVGAGLGFSIAQVLDESLPSRYPLQCLPLDKTVPTFDIALVHRQAEEDDLALQALLGAVRKSID